MYSTASLLRDHELIIGLKPRRRLMGPLAELRFIPGEAGCDAV